MKFSIGICVALAIFSAVTFSQNHTLRYVNAILNGENRLLNDEVGELRYVIHHSRTYEDGFRDAMMRSGEKGTFAEGFNAAKLKYENKSYADGYHAAVDQFGSAWFDQKMMQPKEPELEGKGAPGIERKVSQK